MRTPITEENVDNAFDEAIEKMHFRLKEKGRGTLTSIHEIFGMIQEEVHELQIEMHKNGTDEDKIEELLDIAVAAIFSIACIKQGTLDW